MPPLLHKDDAALKEEILRLEAEMAATLNGHSLGTGTEVEALRRKLRELKIKAGMAA
jgi:hypothetical protein